MRLPQQQQDSLAFSFDSANELVSAFGKKVSTEEAAEIHRLFELGLPPITSQDALAVMIGYNPGFVWSLLNRTKRYYRIFEIKKGTGTRQIEAPKVALKGVQKWLSIHFEKRWEPNEIVHGFVRGKSHITAASQHLNAKWIYSVDIQNFFPSTPESKVIYALKCLGYNMDVSIDMITSICCLGHRLPQGAPTSPILSNIALHEIDIELASFAKERKVEFTRYADDLVFSGKADFPDDLVKKVDKVFDSSVWKLSERKKKLSKYPERLKVHGLLVHGSELRLTKGYRNRLRAYEHLMNAKKVAPEDVARILGHLNYASQIKKVD